MRPTDPSSDKPRGLGRGRGGPQSCAAWLGPLLRIRNAAHGVSGRRSLRLGTSTALSAAAAQGPFARDEALLRGRGLRRAGRVSAQALSSCVTCACPGVKPVREPDAGKPHVRFDEEGRETRDGPFGEWTPDPKGRKRWGAAGPVHDRARSSLYRTMKEKSHRVSRRCYRSGVDALRGTQTRRLDGHTLYSASHLQIRAERQAAGRRLRHAARELRWWGAPAQGDRHPVRVDQAAGSVSRGRPPAGQGSASDARIAPATALWPRLRLRRLQRRCPAGRRCDPQAPARARSPRRAGPGFAADALAVRERVGARDLIAMGHVLADAVIEHQRRRLRGRATRITNDLDPTDDPTHGQQEFTFFNGHYDTWCYLPVVATVTFNAEAEQYAVAAVLRPGNA